MTHESGDLCVDTRPGEPRGRLEEGERDWTDAESSRAPEPSSGQTCRTIPAFLRPAEGNQQTADHQRGSMLQSRDLD